MIGQLIFGLGACDARSVVGPHEWHDAKVAQADPRGANSRCIFCDRTLARVRRNNGVDPDTGERP